MIDQPKAMNVVSAGPYTSSNPHTFALLLLFAGVGVGCSSPDRVSRSAAYEAAPAPLPKPSLAPSPEPAPQPPSVQQALAMQLSVARDMPISVDSADETSESPLKQSFSLNASVTFQADADESLYTHVMFPFSGYCAPALEVYVVASDNKRLLADVVRAFDGDWNSDAFLLWPYLDEIRQVLTRRCPELEDISFMLVDTYGEYQQLLYAPDPDLAKAWEAAGWVVPPVSAPSERKPFVQLHASAANGWKLVRESFAIDPAYQERAALEKASASALLERQAARERKEGLFQERLELARQKQAAEAALAARVAQLQQNSPFAGYPAGLYFAALFERDYELTARLDERYSAVYRLQMAGGAAQAFALVDMLFSGRTEGLEEATDGFRELVESSSLMESMLGHYLKSYSRVYAAPCLGDDALSARIVISKQLVDGSGMPIGPSDDTPIDYPVKREFYGILHSMATRAEGLSADLDGLFQGQSPAISQANMLAGIDRIMQDYACDSPEILGLEEGFQEYWAIVQARMEPARRKIKGER